MTSLYITEIKYTSAYDYHPPREEHKNRKQFFTTLKNTNRRIIPDRTNKRHIVFRQISILHELLDKPELTTHIANDLLNDCEGVFFSLRLGRLYPSLTCIFRMTRYSQYLKQDQLMTTIKIALSNKLIPADITAQAHSTVNVTPTRPVQPTLVKGRGGRTRTPNTQSLFKPSPLNTYIISSKNKKHHAIFNGIGGIATANIYYCHFEENNLIFLVHTIPYMDHQSFDTPQEAMMAFRRYYRHCNTLDNINYMNANAPLEASNLNNPCPLIRAKIREYRPDPTLKERIWPHNLSNPIIKALCEALSQRMMNNNASPTDSYDFLDTNFARENLHYDVAKINLDCLQHYVNDNQTLPTQNKATTQQTQPLNDDGEPHDQASTMNISHINMQPQATLEDDSMSQLSHHTENLSLTSYHPSSPKRARHTKSVSTFEQHRNHEQTNVRINTLTHNQPQPSTTTTFINFIVNIDAHPDILRNELKS